MKLGLKVLNRIIVKLAKLQAFICCMKKVIYQYIKIAKRVPVEHPQFAGENIGNIPYRNKFWRICRIR